MGHKSLVEFADVTVTASTDKALLVVIPEHSEEPLWVPRSQIDESSEVQEDGDEGMLVVTEWIAKEKELI
jgi:hypothetical protein